MSIFERLFSWIMWGLIGALYSGGWKARTVVVLLTLTFVGLIFLIGWAVFT